MTPGVIWESPGASFGPLFRGFLIVTLDFARQICGNSINTVGSGAVSSSLRRGFLIVMVKFFVVFSLFFVVFLY